MGENLRTKAEFMSKALLPDSEVVPLIENFLKTKGEAGAAEDEVKDLVEWAQQVRLDALLLRMVIDGQIEVVRMDDGQPLLRNPTDTSPEPS